MSSDFEARHSQANSFVFRTYAKRVRNSCRMCTYKNIRLKVVQNEQMQEKDGAGVTPDSKIKSVLRSEVQLAEGGSFGGSTQALRKSPSV